MVLSLFEFLLAGLVCTVLVCAARKNRGRTGERRSLLLLACAFLLLSGHFLYDVFEPYLGLSAPAARVHSPLLKGLVEGFETGAFALLLACYRPAADGIRRRMALAAGIWAGASHTATLNWVLLAALLAFLLTRRAGVKWFPASPVLAGALAATCRLPQVWGGGLAWREYAWAAEQLLTLASLVLFALVFERRARSLNLTVFVRLNLILIVVASLLVLVVTHAERAQLTRFEEAHLDGLAEYLRGAALRSYVLGRSADSVVADPAIIRKVVSEFGNIPDLRRVRVRIGERTMEMAIRQGGLVHHAVFPGGVAADPEPTGAYSPSGERLATLARMPIHSDGKLIGIIELDESLAGIDAAIARQISRIFLAFTALVLLSWGLIGLTVRSASRTIQVQYDEIERTNQQLLQAAKLASLGELAGGVAHEINNPAGIIVTRADYMLAVAQEDSAPAELTEGIQVVRHQAERISEIVRGLLTFSRPARPAMRSVDLNEVLQQTLALIRPRCNSAGIRITCCLANGLPLASADANQIGQVFVNVLNNAIDAMPQGGQLTVRTGVEQPGMIFGAVTDTGCGVSEKHLAKIFDPFFTTKPPGQGTGLGLAISYGIMRDHGGEIRVSSAVEGGATFTVVLPAKG